MYNLGLMFADGALGPADPPGAFRWMQRAAAGGHATASYHLASYYDAGHGVAQDRETGARHLVEAARTGTPELVTYISSANAKWKPSTDLIAALQRRLIEAGAYQGPVDGKLSPDLTAALTRLQRGSAQ
jgi:TPR repeat protein